MRKADKRDNDIRSHNPAVDLKIAILSKLAATIQQEVDALGEYMKTHSVALKEKVDSSEGINLAQELRSLEIEIIMYALNCTRGRQTEAARLLGVKPTTLNAKLKKFGISSFNWSGPGLETVTKEKQNRFSLEPHQITREAVADNARQAV